MRISDWGSDVCSSDLELVPIGGADQDGRCLQRVEPRVVQGVGHRADLLDVDAVDLGDLRRQQALEAGVGQVDHELVDGPAAAPLQDVHAHDLAHDRKSKRLKSSHSCATSMKYSA